MHEPIRGSVSAILENYRRYLSITDAVEYDIYRREGTPVPCICYNDVREESEDPNCPLCDGSGYSTKYMLLETIKVRVINPKTETVFIQATFGEMDIDMRALYGWTLYTPPLETEDVLVERFSDRAYEIQSIVTSMIGDKPIRQAFNAKLNTRIAGIIKDSSGVI